MFKSTRCYFGFHQWREVWAEYFFGHLQKVWKNKPLTMGECFVVKEAMQCQNPDCQKLVNI